MSRYLKSLACVVCVLSVAGNLQGATVTWTGAGADSNWTTPENWDSGTVPVEGDIVRCTLVPGAIVVNEIAAYYSQIFVQFLAGTGELTVDGGALTCGLLEVGGRRDGTQGTLHMKSGTITTDRLYLSRGAGSIGRVNLHGGTIYANWFERLGGNGNMGILDVTAGKLVMDGTDDATTGNDFDTLQGYIDSNDPNTMVFAYQGRDGKSHGDLILTYDEVKNQTILTAIHNLRPNPIDAGIALPGEVELSWTLPDPNVPGTPMAVDVYFTDDYQALYEFTDPAAIQIVNRENDKTSVIVQTESKKRYYWAVDVDVNADGQISLDEYGPIFSFLADNSPPEVSAGSDINTHLVDGTRTGPLQGTVTDDGESYTVTWSVVEQPSDADPNIPGAVIADPAALETTITVSAVGTYVLKLETFDGEYTDEDEMVITVHPDDWPK